MTDEQQQNDEEKKEEQPTDNSTPVQTTEDLANEYFNNWKRALADYDNLKKQTAREKTEMGQFARSLAAYEFAAIYDNFKKAATHLPEAGDNLEEYKKRVNQWAVGIDFIKKQFGEVLKQFGLEEVKTVGEKFNPAWHEAAGEEKVENSEPGIVLKEIEAKHHLELCITYNG